MKERLTNYLKSNTKIKIAGDIFFYLLIILLLIPYTRREIVSTVKRVTLMKPSIKEASALAVLNESDYALQFENQEGAMLSLNDFKGEVLFVNFWATWCPPCRAEMPSIQRLYDEYGGKIGFLIITGEETEPVMKYIQSNNFTFPVLYQRSNLPSSFKVSGIPHTYVINRQGEILMSKTGAARWDAPEFKEFLNKLISL